MAGNSGESISHARSTWRGTRAGGTAGETRPTKWSKGGGTESALARMATAGVKAAIIVGIATVITLAIARFGTRGALGVIGGCVGVLILCRPFVGLLLVIASLPFETSGMLGDAEAAGAISVTKLAGLATIGSAILDVMIRGTPIVGSRLFNRIGIGVCLLALVMAGSAWLHMTEESVKETIRFVTLVAFFLVTAHLVDGERRLRTAIVAWVAVASVVGAYSLWQRQFGPTVSSIEWEPTAGTVVDVSEAEIGVMIRAAGTFTHPAWLALYLSLSIPLTLSVLWTSRGALVKAALAAALVVQAGAILATYARMGYLGMALGVGLFLIRRRGGAMILLWMMLATVAVYPMWPASVKGRVESILDYQKSSSSVTRIGQLLVGWWMFRDHALTGVGPGNFELAVPRYADRVPDKWRIEEIGAHNMYVEMLAELGVQGVALVVLLLWWGWRGAERSRRAALGRGDDSGRSMGLVYEGMAASVVIFAVSAALVHAQYQKEWWLLLALISSGWWITRRQGVIDSRGVIP